MQTNTWKTFIWQDMNLVWDPDDYGGLATVCLPADSIWTPVKSKEISMINFFFVFILLGCCFI